MATEPRLHAGLLALCFGNFVIGTGTLIVPGMLPALAEGLGVSLPVAGQLITAFAAAVCIGAPLLAGATSRLDRRSLLVAIQLVFLVGHGAAALLSSFVPMLAARVFSSVGAALFSAQAAATAALLVPPENRGRAIAFVFLGWSIASVAGLPLGAYVAATLGWRAGFALVAAGALAAAAAIRVWVPSGLRVQPADARMWREILGNRTLLEVVAVTALLAGSAFGLFAYLVPAMQAFLHPSPGTISLLLAAFGIAGVLANMLAIRFMDRLGAGNVVLVCLLSMLAAHLLLPWSRDALPVAFAVVLLWGAGALPGNSAQQTRLATLAPGLASVSIALNTSAVFLGQAAGAAAGGLLLAHVPGVKGFALLPWISVPLFVAAIGMSLYASRKMPASTRSVHVQRRAFQR